MPPAFSGWFSQGFVDFCSCSCLYSCLLSCEVLTFCVCVSFSLILQHFKEVCCVSALRLFSAAMQAEKH